MSAAAVLWGLRVAACVALLGAGWWLGSEHVRAEWLTADNDRMRAAQAREASARRAMAIQSDAFEADIRSVRQQLQEARHALQQDLRTPVRCAPGQELDFGDLPVPAGVVRRLRSAGADVRTP